MKAMMQMQKIDINKLKAAYAGNDRSESLWRLSETKAETIDEYLAGVSADQRSRWRNFARSSTPSRRSGGVHQLWNSCVSPEWTIPGFLRRMGESLLVLSRQLHDVEKISG
jgi:hypothetical protein